MGESRGNLDVQNCGAIIFHLERRFHHAYLRPSEMNVVSPPLDKRRFGGYTAAH
jgi:hypothetical protein